MFTMKVMPLGLIYSLFILVVIASPVYSQQSVASFTLINADTNSSIAGYNPLNNGSELNLATLPTNRLNICANTNPEVVGSVVFELNGSEFMVESVPPYAMAGDMDGDYFAWTPSVGGYTVRAIPYTQAGGNGTAGTALTISFSVIDTSPSPTIPAGADGAFVEENGLLVIEVESVPPTGEWAFRTDFSGYSGTGYYIWTGPNYFQTPGQGIIEYPIYINNPGNYRLSLRNRHEHPDPTEENDCWTKMDDGPYTKLYSPERAVWTWWVNHEHADHTHTEARYNLSAGLHTFIISGRSNNFMIDRMHFYLDSVQNPLSLSHPESQRMGSDYTPAPTLAPTNTPSNTPTRTPSRTPSNTPTRTPTSPATSTPTWTRTFTPTNTPTNTPAGPNMTATVTVLMGRPGDANKDLFVNAEDYRAVRDHFGQSTWDIGDANADGFVNSADYRAVRDNFGQSYLP